MWFLFNAGFTRLHLFNSAMELRFVHSPPCCCGEGPRTILTIFSDPLVLLGFHYRDALFGRLSFSIFPLYLRRVEFFCSIRALFGFCFGVWLAEDIFLPSNFLSFGKFGFVMVFLVHC